ncbi:MAG: GTP cyclohydrolase I FolE [Muribaculaceae bacterium]|nr:GTP cyclohydrolase I FolE [Muribaculaceae bacterium]MDE6540435.1 GTP cyclohydrolase I FolE [Muribaculaceae bacterium]
MNSNLTDDERIGLIAGHISEIISLIGEDTDREGLVKTPMRAAKALWFLTSGYRTEPAEVMQQALFAHDGSQMIVVRDIEFYSLCEHHMLPFFGTISVGYIPDGKIIGLSKLARCVEVFARRLQVQERITAQLCREVERQLGASGVMVVCRARHLCMQMRGVEKQNATTVTTHAEGRFATDAALRAEFLQAVSSN